MRLFVACAGPDEPVRELINILDDFDHQALLDLWLLAGPRYPRKRLRAVIQRSDALLLIITPESMTSERCHWEVAEAKRQGVPVVEVLFGGEAAGAGLVEDASRDGMRISFADGLTPEAVGSLLRLLDKVRPLMANRRQEPQARGQQTGQGWVERLTGQTSAAVLLTLAFILLANLVSSLGVTVIVAAEPVVITFLAALLQAGGGPIFALPLVLVTFLPLRFSMVVHVLLQSALLLGYLLTPGAGFWSYATLALVGLLGVVLGRLRLLLWPWLTYRMMTEHRRLVEQLEAGVADSERIDRLVHLLDQPLAIPPGGSTAAMLSLATAGLSPEEFVARTENVARQQRYQAVVGEMGLRKLRQASGLEDALSVIERHNLVPDSSICMRSMLEKVRYAGSGLEKLRIYARFLQQLEDGRQALRREHQPNWQQTLQIYQFISDLIYQAIDFSQVQAYWATYDALEAAVGNIRVALAARREADGDPHSAVERALQQLGQAIDGVQCLRLDMGSFSAREQRWQQAMLETALDPRQFLSMDYQERQALVRREVERLNALAYSQPASWLAIDRNAVQLTEHHNPWCVLAVLLVDLLRDIHRLDAAYVGWAAGELTRVLNRIRSVQDVAELEHRLVNLIISGDSYGSLIDSTLQSLLDISEAASTALRWPGESLQHQQSVIDALEKCNQLRLRLQTRYTHQRASQWAVAVQHMAEVLETHIGQLQARTAVRYRNPYIVGKPIPARNPTLFKGRLELAREIVDWLNSANRPTLVLHGPRRMGKTSFLLQLQNLLRGWNDTYIPVFLSGQEAGVQQNDASFFYFLARAIYFRMVQRTGAQIARPTLEQYTANPYATLSPWLQDQIYPLLEEGQVLLVTIDEFEKVGAAIRSGSLTLRILDFLRDTMQHSEHMLFLFCGVETLDALGPNAASYFISVQTVEISYLSEKAAQELIRMPTNEPGDVPTYEREVVAEILRLTNCHPFLIQAICYKIVDIANHRHLQRIRRPVLEEAVNWLYGAHGLYFEHLWEDVGEEGRRLLELLAEGPVALTREQIGSVGGQALLKRRLISQDAEGRHRIAIPLVQEWVSRRVVGIVQ
ncbi:MAG: hypothetical protein HPY64_11690 [Anaerolineae bacterium]|nr:hypothetical protein [Anaerolineae bacterium]